MVTRDLLDETASRPEASAEEDRECVAMIRMQQCQIALLVWFGDMYNRRISQILLRSPNSEQSVVQKPCSGILIVSASRIASYRSLDSYSHLSDPKLSDLLVETRPFLVHQTGCSVKGKD